MQTSLKNVLAFLHYTMFLISLPLKEGDNEIYNEFLLIMSQYT